MTVGIWDTLEAILWKDSTSGRCQKQKITYGLLLFVILDIFFLNGLTVCTAGHRCSVRGKVYCKNFGHAKTLWLEE